MSALATTIAALGILSTAVELVPIIGPNLKAAIELASKVCEKVETIRGNREGYEHLGNTVGRLLMAVSSVLQRVEPEKLGVLQASFAHLMDVLEEIRSAVEKRTSAGPTPTRKREQVASWLRRTGKDTKLLLSDQDEIKELRRKLQEVVNEFQVSALMKNELTMGTVRDLSVNILERIKRLEEASEKAARDSDNAILKELEPVPATWDVIDIPFCSPDTRTSLFDGIWAWVKASSRHPCAFWLSGLAGTGKSTIAHTLCRGLKEDDLLGASFFISRQDARRRDVTDIIHSIAFQLALCSRVFADNLCAELRERPIASPRSVEAQIEDLVVKPARALAGDSALVIVIDALDECVMDARGRHGGDLLLKLVQGLLRLSGRLRLFITSRGETPIERMFNQLSISTQQIVMKLQDLDTTTVQGDIRKYVTCAFADIREARTEFDLHDWPAPSAIDGLVNLSGTLFVYASTAVRFVEDWNYSPRKRLGLLMDRRSHGSFGSPYHHLDQLYVEVLTNAIHTTGDDVDHLYRRIRVVVAVIILAQHPLCVAALAALSGQDLDDTQIATRSLSAVLLAEPEQPVRVFHPSFPDFITNPDRCKDLRFLVTPSEDHHILAYHCLTIMDELCYNICGLEDPSQANAEVDDLKTRLSEKVSDALRYAVTYGLLHVSASGEPDNGLIEKLSRFCHQHLFHWLEVLSLTGLLSSAYKGLPGAEGWCEKHADLFGTSQVAVLLDDALRTLHAYADVIKTHALHVYHSAYVTMPQCSLVDALASECTSYAMIRLSSPRASRWGHLRRTVATRHTVTSIAHSPDGERIVSGSGDGILRVWDTITFDELTKLEGHKDAVSSVKFSADGKRIVSGSYDHTVRVWDALTFDELTKLEGHECPVNSVAFSADGKRIVSSSSDCSVRVWDAVAFRELVRFLVHMNAVIAFLDDGSVRVLNTVTHDELGKLRGHSDLVCSVAFSANGKHIVLGLDNGPVWVWDAVTYDELGQFWGHKNRVCSVAFSADGKYVVSGSDDGCVRVWDTVTFDELTKLEGHKGAVASVTFSADGKRIVSGGSGDRTVRVWDAVTYEQLTKFEGHESAVTSVTFSPDGKRVVSGSSDHTVRVWDTVAFDALAKIEGATNEFPVNCIAFSPNGERIVSGSNDGFVRVWKVATLRMLAKLKGEPHGRVYSVAISADGKRIVSGFSDGSLQVWDAVTFDQLANLEIRLAVGGSMYRASSVAFSDDGNTVFSHHDNGITRAWSSITPAGTSWALQSSETTTADPGDIAVRRSSRMPHIFIKAGWLRWDTQPRVALWLPRERRGQALISHGPQVAVGGQDGAITFLDFAGVLGQ